MNLWTWWTQRTAQPDHPTPDTATPQPTTPRGAGISAWPLGGMFKAGQVDTNDLWSSIPVSRTNTSPNVFQSWSRCMREQWSNNDHVKRYIDLCRRNIVAPAASSCRPKAENRAAVPWTPPSTTPLKPGGKTGAAKASVKSPENYHGAKSKPSA